MSIFSEILLNLFFDIFRQHLVKTTRITYVRPIYRKKNRGFKIPASTNRPKSIDFYNASCYQKSLFDK